MASTTPKSPVPSAITGEIGHFDATRLKHAETQEKNPLPTKEALAQEKQEKAFRESIEGASIGQLKHVEVQEKHGSLPDSATINQEKTMQNIEGFDKHNLKHAETQEKNALPDTAVINQEKTIQNIEGFDKSILRHAETKEKNPLPDKAAIEEEKRLSKGSS